MIIELHLLQNFVPSNLNRDDTGSPKDCEFGGYRRARISSQCQKRAMRQFVQTQQLLDPGNLGHRTKRLFDELTRRAADKPPELLQVAISQLLASQKLTVDPKKENQTQYLLFLGEREIAGLADMVDKFWDQLSSVASEASAEGKKKSKKDSAKSIPPEIGKGVAAILDGGKAADVAMFGRMLADLPEMNIDAASQVAHAISVNKADFEFDYYTAVDDLKPNDTAGADMIGTVELTSACFYRYINIHGPQLVANLQGDAELAEQSVRAFMKAAIEAVPTGKQNSTAAHNPPSFVMAVVRPTGCVNLANAFLKPVRASGPSQDLMEQAIIALDRQWDQTNRMYPVNGVTVALAMDRDVELKSPTLQTSVKTSVDEVTECVLKAIHGKLKETK